jgi:GH15 family glucan-1,4-alpha-glucosidase
MGRAVTGESAERHIENYGLLSDCRSAALVNRDGSIDWLCWPRFDSAACFARLLGDERHGFFSIAPQARETRVVRRYASDTLILETEFDTAEGSVRMTDFMPIETAAPTLIRLVVGLRGRTPLRMRCAPRFDYGALAPWIVASARGARLQAGPDELTLEASVPLEIEDQHCGAQFVLESGQRASFVLSYGSPHAHAEPPGDPQGLLERTAGYWRDWIGRLQHPCDWPEALRRSLLTLRAMIHRPSGGLLAAPTTSLPEQLQGPLNWDYRFAWLRDSTFTLTALLNAGYREEAQAWRDWILRALGSEPAKMRTMYRVDGGRDVNECTLDWLPGFHGARPVRVGNAAAYQRQIDIYGEVLDAMELATRAGIPQSEHGKHIERGIAEYLESIWDETGRGIWESREESHRYVYSQVMAWVGIDRFVRSAGRHGHADAALLDRLKALREQIHAQICEQGYDASRGHFVQHYGDHALDGSLLLLPLVGFLPVEDERIAGTIAAVERELLHDGLVMRQQYPHRKRQGAFIACTCWLADCRRLQGRVAEARGTIERVLAVSNDLGLLAEEYDIHAQQLCGNFPQALSHLALVNAILGMDGPMLQRGGG